MTNNHRRTLNQHRGETRRFRLRPDVAYEGVSWFRADGVYEGKMLADRTPTVRLYAPDSTHELSYVDVPSYWVVPDR